MPNTFFVNNKLHNVSQSLTDNHNNNNKVVKNKAAQK